MNRPVFSLTDLVTWVGSGAYPTIEDYITEANSRGCCRRMPYLPGWVIPGKTRVFLVHQGDQPKNGDTGVLFGYYTLNRIQYVRPGPALVLFGGGHDLRDYHPVWVHPRRPSPHTIRQHFGHWVLEKEYIIIKKREPEDPLDALLETLWDELLDWLLENLTEQVPDWMIEWEPGRMCGDRGEGAPYYMDDRAAEYYDWLKDFIEWLLEEDEEESDGEIVKVRYHWHDVEGERVKVDVQVPPAHRRLRKGFSPNGRVCVDCLPKTWSHDVHGLVLFEKPYPIYHRPPKALFRGFDRVDGDALLARVTDRAPAVHDFQPMMPV